MRILQKNLKEINLYEIDIDHITNPAEFRKVLIELFNMVELLKKENSEQKQLIQELRDENNRLKGEKGKPSIKANKEKSSDLSSEMQTKVKKHWLKKGKKEKIKIDKTVKCTVDRGALPSDAVFKGHDRIISQNIIFKRENTEYLVELYYSPSEKKTYRGALPEEYSGYFSRELKAFCTLSYQCLDVTRNKLLSLLRSMGYEISDGSLNNILQENSAMWIEEKHDILFAGLSNGVAQTDITGARVNGKNHYTHIICGQDFTVYSTLPSKSRRDVLMAFMGEPDGGLLYQYNKHTLWLLEHFNIAETDKQAISEIFTPNQIIQERLFNQIIQENIPSLYAKPNMFRRVCDSFALAHFYELGLLKILVSDDAPEYELITLIRMLCWIHDARHYKKLNPVFDHHRKILDNFTTHYWDFYKKLLDYTKNPQHNLVLELQNEFDLLFAPNTNYYDLDKQINRTLSNKEKLLTVLEYPFLPLHNNLSELGARRQVRKRDISLHTMTSLGTKLQDAFMSITQTCLQLNVDVWQYILSRLSNSNQFYLPDLIKSKYCPSE